MTGAILDLLVAQAVAPTRRMGFNLAAITVGSVLVVTGDAAVSAISAWLRIQ